MKRNLYIVSLFLFFFSLKGIAAIPEGAIFSVRLMTPYLLP